jgi:predicted phosphodiesterase
MAIYGILGDIHGNREALAAALERLDDCGVERLLCVGDLVGYNADGDDCVALLRSRGVQCISGNHDLIGTGQLGFERCSNKAMHSLKRTRRTLGAPAAAYLRSLPSHRVIDDLFLLTHGGVRDVQQYMTKPRHFLQNAEFLRRDFPGIRICFYGHTHEQRVFEIDRIGYCDLESGATTLRHDREYFVNPGSIDASRKHGAKLAEFALFDTASRSVEFHRVPYDAMVTERKAEAGGYRIDRWRDVLYDVRRRVLGPRQVDTQRA